MNLIEGVQQEMNRCRDVLKLYQEIPEGTFGATMIQNTIRIAENTIASGDVIEMLKVYEELKSIK